MCYTYAQYYETIHKSQSSAKTIELAERECYCERADLRILP